MLKSLSFYVEHHQTIYLGRLKRIKTLESNANFWPKLWVNPSAKMPVFTTMLKFHFRTRLKSLAMYVEHYQTIYLGLLKKKENLEGKRKCLTKIMG